MDNRATNKQIIKIRRFGKDSTAPDSRCGISNENYAYLSRYTRGYSAGYPPGYLQGYPRGTPPGRSARDPPGRLWGRVWAVLNGCWWICVNLQDTGLTAHDEAFQTAACETVPIAIGTAASATAALETTDAILSVPRAAPWKSPEIIDSREAYPLNRSKNNQPKSNKLRSILIRQDKAGGGCETLWLIMKT
jgi:hypothetical protein